MEEDPWKGIEAGLFKEMASALSLFYVDLSLPAARGYAIQKPGKISSVRLRMEETT